MDGMVHTTHASFCCWFGIRYRRILGIPRTHAELSPHYRPDLINGSTVLDVKVGSPLAAKALSVGEKERATHTAFAGTADRFLAKSLGRAQRGAPGTPFDHSTGDGYVAGVYNHDYRFALARDTKVVLLIHETLGGLHSSARAYLHELARAAAARKAGSEHDEAAASGFRGYWRARISASLARALGEQLLAGAPARAS